MIEKQGSINQLRPMGARRSSQSIQYDRYKADLCQNGFFKSFDGTRLFFSTEGSGKPLIFCYGLVCSSLHWTYQIDHFRKTHQAVWFDYRGHHNSDTPSDLKSLNIENIAHDLECLLDELKIQDAIFLGHSMGVNVVLEFFKRAPHRVAGLVLANGTARRPLETLFNNNSLQAGFKLLKRAYDKKPDLFKKLWKLQKGNPLSRSLIAMGGFNPYLTAKEDIALYVDQVAQMDPQILLRLIEDYDQYDASPWVHQIKVPTLLIAGDQDRIIPLHEQQLLTQLIPQSELCIVKHGSHCPQMDLPDLVNTKIEIFLEKNGY